MPLFDQKMLGLILQDGKLVVTEIEHRNGAPVLMAITEADIPLSLISEDSLQLNDRLGNFIYQQLHQALPQKIDTRAIIFEIPSEHLFHLMMSLPKNLKQSELELAASVEAQKSLPLELKDLAWDLRRSHLLGDQQLVFMTAVKKDVIEKYYQFFREFDLIPIAFTSRVDNLRSTLFQNDGSLTFVLDLGIKNSQLILFNNHRPIHLSSFNAGEENLQLSLNREDRLSSFDDSLIVLDQCLDVLHGFADEVRSFFEHENVKEYFKASYVQQKGAETKAPKSKFLLLGNTIYHKAFSDFFARESIPHLELPQLIKPQQISLKMTPWIEKAPFFPLLDGEKQKKSFFGHPHYQSLWLSALGAAQFNSIRVSDFRPLNFLPHSGKTLAFFKMGEGFLKLAAVVLMVVCVGWMFIFTYAWMQAKETLIIETSRLEQLETVTNDPNFRLLQKKVNSAYVPPHVAEAKQANRKLFAESYSEFVLLAGKGIQVTEFSLDTTENTAIVKGTATGVPAVAFLNKQIEDSLYFKAESPASASGLDYSFETLLQILR